MDPRMTSAQRALLERNPHLVPAARLEDGDWLVLDREGPGAESLMSQFNRAFI